MEHQASEVIFGLNPLWLATSIFVLSYALIVSEKINRSIIALLGAGLMIILGVLNQQAAIDGIDFNTLGLLTGMMVIVAISRRSGIFQYVAVWSAKKVKASPWGILFMFSLVTAVFSALLDNVTTVLLIAPVTLLITEELRVHPYPFLFAEIFASNIGGTATLIGDPPNIMIGSAVNLTFNDFLFNLAPITILIFPIVMFIIYLIWGRHMQASAKNRERIMKFREKEAITDVPLLKKSLLVISLVIIAFLFAHSLHLEPATIAMMGAALLLLLTSIHSDSEEQNNHVHSSFAEVEWVTIFFFVGLFILVTGLEHTGLLTILANKVLAITKGDMAYTAMAIIWASAIFSAIVDNIPFVATMIPIIKSMAPVFGGADQLMPLWWSLALGACLGGNGSLVGASANLIVAGFAERAGYRINFLKFMLMAFPLMLLTVFIASIYVYLRYL